MLNPEAEFAAVRESAAEALGSVFPIVSRAHELRLDRTWVEDKAAAGDIKGQLEAKLEDRTWGVPLYGRLRLLDRATGKTLDTKDVRLTDLPKLTPRLGYIVGGKEYQLDRQWRLKPGVYARIKDNGELESHINVAGGQRFAINFDPTSRRFNFDYAGSSIPLAPLLHTMGVGDADLRRTWGPEIYAANAAKHETALRKFYKVDTGKDAPSLDAAAAHVRQVLGSKEVSPDVTEYTLGKRVARLDGPALAMASRKLLDISRGTEEPDDRDAIIFKTLHSTEDMVGEKLRVMGTGMRRRLGNVLDRHSNLDRLVYPGMFDRAVSSVFTESTTARVPTQDNPVDFLEGFSRTTILGPGAIGDIRMVTEEAKAVDSTHLGFLDPVDTPEGERVGISSHLALGVSKKGTDIYTPVFDTGKGEMRAVTPAEFYRSYVALPDSVRWERGPGGRMTPRPLKGQTVRAVGPGNAVVEVPLAKVDYVVPNATMLLGVGTNLVPFLQNNSGNRASMSARHLSQSLPLVHREPPLVKAVGPLDNPMDDIPGRLTTVSSKVDGTVTKVDRGEIHVRDAKGKAHIHQIYDYFPLNDSRAGIHSDPLVHVGDKVKARQILADSSFTRNGQLALGTNLRAAMIPIPSKTFEDAVVVSESAAKKLSSAHLHRHQLLPDEQTRPGKKAFAAYYPTRYGESQLGKLDEDGVIREGQTVEPGDPLTVLLREQRLTSEAQAIAKLKRSLIKPYSDASHAWDQDVPGRVVRVHKLPDGRAHVFVATEEPLQIADKISNRHAGKGTVVEIVPDDQMPRDARGKPVEIVINPYSVPGRMNVGQVYEMAAGKIAIKTGKPYHVRNFLPDMDYGAKVRAELKEHGLSDQEDLFDPKTGQRLGSVLVGPMHVLKQRHQVERKIHARAGGPGYPYDVDRQPRRGGEMGAQSLGGLGQLALLAHGSRNILREAATLKSDLTQQDELWRAIQMGQPLPPPKPTFTQRKLENYLYIMGVKLKKDGTRIQMIPLTDREVLRASSGELQRPDLTLKGHELVPESGGLFDLKITGGLDGERMAHIRLPEPMPNPFFERGVQALTGLTQVQLMDVVGGKLALDENGAVVKPKTPGALTGPKAIAKRLGRVDVAKDIKALRDQLPRLIGPALDKANRKLRYLEALDGNHLSPEEAYMTTTIPVLPPNMRPITVLPSGDLASDPLNETYKALGTVVAKAKELDPDLPERSRGRLRRELYASLAALQGVGAGYKRVQGGETQGIMDIFTQPTAKHAWIHNRLFKQRQDLSARSVIVPDPTLTIDEIGVPHRIATEIYKPFTVRELTRSGYSPLKAEQMIKQNDPVAEAMLRRVMDERLVLAKRDPVLHKYGIQAFKPRLDKGLAIKINPLVTGGFGADFDGDQMGLFVPITQAAQRDARKMLPSANLLNPATGRPVYTPSNEMALGLYRMTTIRPGGKPAEYKTQEEALADAARGGLKWETVRVGGKTTTAGRLKLYSTLPAALRSDDILYDAKHVWDSKRTNTMLERVAREHPQEYASVAQNVMDLGSRNVYEDAFSISMNDFIPDKESREKALSFARTESSRVLADKRLSRAERDDKITDVWLRAGKRMEEDHWKRIESDPPQLAQMALAGVKPSRDQYKQLVLAPMIMTGTKGKLIPDPVSRSYSEGLDTAGFWVQSQAARVAAMRKTQEVREPGYLSKQVVNTVADMVVAADDCGTDEGVTLPVDHPDVCDRYLVKGSGPARLPAGALLTPADVGRLRTAGVQSVVVRSPLKCRLPQGVCSHCMGLSGDGHLHGIGTNVGVLAGQAIGERSTQLMLKAPHLGGVVERGSGATLIHQFDRIEQLLRMPKTIPDAAVLAETSGTVRRIRPDPAGGQRLTLEGTGGRELEQHVPAARRLAPGVRVGSKVEAGQPLSSGNVNAHDLLRTAGLPQVQNQITTELDDIYRPQGIRRRNVEVVVRGVTNLGVVEDPGENETLRRGDSVPLSVVEAWNAKHRKNPARAAPVLKGIAFAPLDLTEDWLAKLHHERLKDTLVDAALEGHQSNISGYNPFAALAFSPATFGLGPSGLPGAY